VKGNATAALDIHGDVFVAERTSGDLGLYSMSGNVLMQSVALPPNALGRLRAATVSRDLKWLAVSERSRGAVWDLTRGERVFHIRGFRGGFFDDTGALYADFPKAGAEARTMVRLDLAQKQSTSAGEIADDDSFQSGRLLLARKEAQPGRASGGVRYEVRDVRRPAPLWSKAFQDEPPSVWAHAEGDTVILSLPASSPAGREFIRKDPVLSKTVKLGDIEGDYVLDILDADTGTPRRRMLFETGKGSFRIADLYSRGDWLVVSDSMGRVLVYALGTGELKGHVFGNQPVISPASGLLAVENGHKLVLYDLATLKRRDELTFADSIAVKSFSADGRRLFVLTASQTAYVLDVVRDGAQALQYTAGTYRSSGTGPREYSA
jgi:hypothetical protein